MSTTIDERVLEMRFDNRQFENGVSHTMSTLDKLKEKLNFTGASKGLENVNVAAKNVNMTGLGSAVQTVTAKFSALQVMGVTALANITNSAVNAGKRIVKSLTLDPIKSGFDEYETKMGSIQTILANTEHQGTTLDDVTAALEKLNIYADKTIYNFQQMTKNIGTFTAAGVDLDTSVKSIQGIANLAAVSGSTSQQASTAMYQLSQALSSGTVRLQDWNSVVNAGMGGKVFQNALIRTAAVMAGASEDVAAWQKENIDSFGSFRDSLTQGGWLTTDVLTRTLEQFTLAAEEGSEEWNEFKKSLMSDGYTEKQAEEILKMANTATDAATKVKTFTQLMDTLKESAQSGWAQTWELLIGDFEEAKEFFTGLSDMFGGIIGSSADRRNSLLSGALDSNWDKLIKQLNEAGIGVSDFEEAIDRIGGKDLGLQDLITEYGSLEKAIRDGAITSDILKKALDEIAGTNADSKISGFVDGLKEIERTLRSGHVGDDVKKLQTALDELGYDLGESGIDGILGPITEEAVKAFQEINGLDADGVVGPKTLEALEKAGAKVKETAKDVDGLKKSCGSLIDVITEKSGRELLLDSLMNVIKAIQRPLSAVGEALRDVFSISPDALYDALQKINRFTNKLVPKGILDSKTWTKLSLSVTDLGIEYEDFVEKLEGTLKEHGVDVDELKKEYGDLGKAFEDGAISFDIVKEVLLSFDGITESLLEGGEVAEKVRRTFEGLFAIFEILATLAAGPIKIAFNLVTKVLGKLGLSLLDVTAGIGDSLVSLRDSISNVVDTVTDFIATNVAEWVTRLKESEIIRSVAEWFESAKNSISDSLDIISKKFTDFDTSNFMDGVRSIGDFLSNIATNLADSEIFMTIVDGVCSAFKKLKEFFTGFKLPEFNLSNLRIFAGLGETLEGSGGFGASLVAFGKWAKDRTIYNAKIGINNLFSVMNWDSFKALAAEKFIAFWTNTGDKIKLAFEKCKEILKAVAEFVFGTETVSLPAIMDVAEKFLGLLVLIKTLQLLNTLSSPLDNVTDAIDNLAKKLKWEAIGAAFKAMALALGTLTVCIVILANMPDMNKAWQAAGMLAVLLLVMGGLIAGLMALSSALKTADALDVVSVALSLGLLIGAVLLMVMTLEKIDSMTLVDPFETFVAFGVMLAGLAAGIKIVAAAGSSSFKSVAAILTLVAALNMMLDVIDRYDQHNWAGQGDAIMRVAGMLILLSAAINIASRGVQSGASASGLAALLLAMVFSLKMLIEVMEDFASMDVTTLVKGGITVAALLFMMAQMVKSVAASNQGAILEKGQKSVNSFAGLAVALLAVVASIWILGKLANKDPQTFFAGAATVGAILLAFTGIISAIGRSCSGLKMGTIVVALVGMGLLIAEIAAILKWLETIPWQQSIGTAGSLAIVLIAMITALKVISKNQIDSGNIAKWEFALLGMVGLVWALSLALSEAKGLDIASAIALSILLNAMAISLRILSKVGTMTDSAYIGIVELTLIVHLLVPALKALEGVTPAKAIGNAIALSILLNAMASALWILSNSKTISDMALIGLVTLTVIIHLLVPAIKDLETVTPMKAIGNAIALSILLNAMASALLILSNSKPIADMALVGLITLTVIIHLLVPAIKELEVVTPMKAIGNAIALSILLNAMASALVILGYTKTITDQAFVGLVALTLIIHLLVPAIKELEIVTPMKAIGNAIALSILLNAMASALLILSNSKMISDMALVGLVTLTLVIHLLVPVIKELEAVTPAKAIGNAIALSILLNAMAAALVILGYTKTISTSALVGMAAMTVVVAALAVILGELAVMKCALSIGNALSISALLIAMSVVYAILGTTGGLAPAAIGGAVGMIAVIAIIGAVAIAIGGLMSLIPSDTIASWKTGFADFMDFLAILAEGLGSIIGSFVGGFTDSLVSIADDLQYFASALGEIDPSASTGVMALCEAIDALVTANLKDAIAQIFPGDNSLSEFGDNISDFALSIKTAAAEVKDITDADVDNITRAADAGAALAKLNDAIPRSGGTWQEWIGEKSLSTWGETIVDFADAIVNYNTKINEGNIDSDKITKSADAAKALADVSTSIPSTGGTWQEWVGEQSLATFGATLVEFAGCLVEYNAAVTGTGFDPDAISKSAEAAKALTEVANAIPETDGEWQDWTGEKNLGTFGSQLATFAAGLVEYCTVASGIDQAKIDSIEFSKQAVEKLLEVVALVPTSGGLWDAIAGAADGQSFGAGIKALAGGIASYCATAAYVDQTDLDKIEFSKQAVIKLREVMDELPDVNASANASSLRIAIDDFKVISAGLNEITVAGYDYTGIDSLKTAIQRIAEIVGEDGAEVTDIGAKYMGLKDVLSIITACSDDIMSLNDRTYTGIDTLKAAVESIKTISLDGITEAFAGSDQVGPAMAGLVDGMASAISENVYKVSNAVKMIAEVAVDNIDNALDDFKDAGKNYAKKFASGMRDERKNVKTAGTDVADEAVAGAGVSYDDMVEVGASLGAGLVEGINSKQDDVWSAGYALGQAAAAAARVCLQINSPSKVFREIGKGVPEGFIQGVEMLSGSVDKSIYAMADGAITSVGNTISKLATLVESDIDAQPTIRPILDLSDVRAGAASIGSLFDTTSQVGVMANVGTVSTMMRGYGQNGGNSDIVSAIDKLRKDLGNISGDTYSFGNITYDDGSNIADAVRTIARAAIMERRM